ncbi:site-2 protease family protein [Candidatus Saccharibacteria bacterium]|nr:site-2 protease family protein [Candidatus Saccharibacteria bacterium]
MNLNFGYVIIVLVIVFFSVTLHELSHGAVAYLLGDRTAKDAGRLTLNPIKHIDPYLSILVPVLLYIIGAPVFGAAKPVPVNYRNLKWREWGMVLVALAGPFANFLIAFLSFLIGHFSGALYNSGDKTVMLIFTELIYVNLGFMLFNLIPVPPLDGSRVLYAISPDSVRSFLAQIEQYGLFIVYALILLFGEAFSFLMVNGANGIISFFYLLVGQ